MSHLKRALSVGAVSLVITLVIAELLWIVWMAPSEGAPEVDELAAKLSFFQAVAAFAATFVAGTLGWLAVQEFREDSKEAELVLDLGGIRRRSVEGANLE